MSILNDLFQGLIILSILALAQYGFSVKDMANQAAKAHKNGLTKYGEYSRVLTGHKKP